MRIAAVIALLVMLSFAEAAEQHATQGDGLSVSLRNLTEQASYGMKDSIVLEFEVINLSSEPIGVFAKLGMGYQGGMVLHVLDSTGAEVESPTLDHDSLDLDAVGDARSYIKLQPYMFLGTRQRYAVSQLVWKPGHYKLLAEYHCPVDSKYAKVGNFWGIERKSVISSEIEVDVK